MYYDILSSTGISFLVVKIWYSKVCLCISDSVQLLLTDWTV